MVPIFKQLLAIRDSVDDLKSSKDGFQWAMIGVSIFAVLVIIVSIKLICLVRRRKDEYKETVAHQAQILGEAAGELRKAHAAIVSGQERARLDAIEMQYMMSAMAEREAHLQTAQMEVEKLKEMTREALGYTEVHRNYPTIPRRTSSPQSLQDELSGCGETESCFGDDEPESPHLTDSEMEDESHAEKEDPNGYGADRDFGVDGDVFRVHADRLPSNSLAAASVKSATSVTITRHAQAQTVGMGV